MRAGALFSCPKLTKLYQTLYQTLMQCNRPKEFANPSVILGVDVQPLPAAVYNSSTIPPSIHVQRELGLTPGVGYIGWQRLLRASNSDR